VADAGSQPEILSSLAGIPADQMLVSIRIDPASPNRTVDGGFFQLTVFLTNPTSQTIRALLPPPRTMYSYSYDIRGPSGGISGGEIVLDSGLVIFGPSQTKRQVWDFKVGDKWPFTLPGTYRFGAAWGDHWVYQSFQIDP
jgi:hypothetical protein